MNDYIQKRFNGIDKIYKQGTLNLLASKHICVIGIGGVGSWTVECLVRSGVGNLTLIDFDNIGISNTNRQIHALSDNYGKNKIDVMKERILKINQQCTVNLIEDFISPDNIEQIMNMYNFDYIIDATDDIKAKTSIAIYCLKNKLPFILCGGAGGKKNPHLIKVDKLSNVEHDPLLAKLRYILRKKYGFKEKININCLYSYEQKQNKLLPQQENIINTCGKLSCDGYGSLVGITATMGFMLGQYVLNKIC